MRRLLLPTLLAAMVCSGAVAQVAPAPAAPPAGQAPSATERNAALEKFRTEIKRLTENMEARAVDLEKNRKERDKAQEYVNELLEDAQAFVNLAAPGGAMERTIRDGIQSNMQKAKEYQLRGWTDLAKSLDAEVKKGEAQIEDVKNKYGEARTMVRNLSEQKERLAAARDVALAEQQGRIIDDMLKIYDEGIKALRNLGQTLATGAGA